MDPGSAVAVFAPLAAVMAAYSLGKVPVVPAAAPAAAAPAPAPAPAVTTAAPPTAASSLGDIPLAAAPAAPLDSDPTPLDEIVDQAVLAAKAEAAKPASKSMIQKLLAYRPFAKSRAAREAAYTARRTQGGRRRKTQRRGGANPVIAPFVARITKKLYAISSADDQKPQIAFSHLLSAGGSSDDATGDRVAALLLPVMRTFTWWRFRVLFAKLRYSPILVADAEDLYKNVVLPQQIQRIFANNDRILYKIKFGQVPVEPPNSASEATGAITDSSVVPENPPPSLATDDQEFMGPAPDVPAAPVVPVPAAAANPVPAAAPPAPAPAPPGAAVVQTTGEPAAGTGLFAAPAAPVAEPAAPVPDTAAIQEAEARVREEAVASQAAAVAAAKAAAIEERTAAVQATEKRIREEAAASQATLEARALAAENALELNKGDVAKKATELVELRASAKNHEDAAHAAAAAALEQEARAQLAEGQLNAAKEALQMLSADQSTSSVSRVRSLAESEANMRTLEENQRIAEAQAKAARVGAPLTTGVGSSSEVLDKFEAPATPPMAAPPVQPAAAAASASEADQIVTMAEQYAERARAAERAQREQTEKTIADEVIATKLAAAAAAAEATAAQVTLERIKRLDGELEQVFIDPNIARRERLDAARTSALLQRKLQPGDAAVRPPLSASPPPPPVAVKTSTVEFDKQLESLNQQLTNRKAERSHAGLPGTFGYNRKDVEVKELEKRIEQIESLKKTASKGGRRRKTSKKRKTRKPRKSTFRRHRKH